MTAATRTALILMLGSPIGFVAGAAWGVFFGFPSPDAGAEESARLQFHANVSGSIMLLAFLAFAASSIYLLKQWLISRKRGRS
jgi:hypothetical protein